jgi:tetratricopeptide (TPR) repeat protein
MSEGRLEEAERVARQYIDEAPMDAMSHFTLGLLYGVTGQDNKAIAPYESAMELDPDCRQDLVSLWNLVSSCDGANENEKCVYWAEQAIAPFERHLKLYPDDEAKRVNLALLLFFAGRREEALRLVRSMSNIRDGNSLFVVAALWIKLGDVSEAFNAVLRSIDAGFREARLLRTFLEDDLVIQSKGTPEYEEAREMVEKIEAEQEEKTNA